MTASAAFRVAAAAALALHAALWVRAGWWYPQLPERFPIHFGADGAPDRWSTRGAMWFQLPGLGLLVLLCFGLLLGLLPMLARRTPGIVNMPSKELWSRLSPEGRVATMAPTRAFLAFVVALVEGLLLAILEGSARVATGAQATLPPWSVLVFLALVLGMLAPLYRSTGRVVAARAREEGVAG